MRFFLKDFKKLKNIIMRFYTNQKLGHVTLTYNSNTPKKI